MTAIDIRIFLTVYALSMLLCIIMMGSLWWQNRKRSPEIILWLASFVLQAAGVLLITFRGVMPDFFTIVFANILVIGGTVVLYAGLCRYAGIECSQLHNYIMLGLFGLVHAYLTYGHPNFNLRVVNLSIAFLFICAQCAWLLLRRVEPHLRPVTKVTGIIFAVLCVSSLIQIAVSLKTPGINDIFLSGILGIYAILTYQIAFIALSITLFLMVNRRLSRDLEEELLQRTQMEEMLRQSEEKFSKAFQISPHAIAITSIEDGQFIEVNDAFAALTGFPREEILAESSIKLRLWVDEKNREEVVSTLRLGLPVISREFQFRKKNGEILNGLYSSQLIRLQNKSYLLSSIEDITERKRTEKLIGARLELLDFAATHSLDELLQKTLDEVGILVDSPIGFYHFVEEDQKTLSLQAWSTRTLNEFCKTEGRGMHYGIDRAGVWVDCVYERKTVIHNDYHALPHRKGLPPGHAAIIREMVVPIMRGERIVAILGVGNKASDYTEKDSEIIFYLADVAWEITQRKRAEEALRRSEERFKQLAEVFPETIFEADMQGHVTYANQRALHQFGVTKEDIAKGVNIFDLVSPDDRNLAKERIQNRIKGGAQRYLEYKAKRKDGSTFDALALSVPNIVDGVPIGIRGFVLDITERKQAEAALKQNQVFLNTLLNSIPVPVFYKNKAGQYTGFNKAYETFFGATQEKLIGKTVFDISPPELAKIYYDKDQELFGGGGDQRYESQVKNAFGETRDVIFNKAVLTDSKGAVSGLIGAIYDITERKKAEETLRESEARLQAITDSAHDAIMMIDNNGNITFWNPAAERILGYTKGEVIGKDLHKLIAPERYHAAHLAAFPEFRKTGQGNAVGKTLELAAVRKDGKEIDIALSLSTVKIENAWHAVGIMQDITERKQAETDLRASEERYHFITDHTADHIWTMDLSMRYVYSSPAVIKLLGYTVEELLEKSFDYFFTPESLVMAQKLLAKELETDKDPHADPNRILTLQSELYRKDGRLVWLESSLTFIRDESLKPVGILGVSRDITERKKSEEQIKHLATHDLLTDLPTLRLARDRMSVAINMARRYKKGVALMFVDLDGFKSVNDTLGHDAGDFVLKEIAIRLLSCVRETDTVARIGGDEFLIIATEMNSPENAAQIAEKVLKLVSQPIAFNGQQAKVGTSIGIALFPDHGDNMDQLIKLADETMYKVKNAGKNGFRFVDTE